MAARRFVVARERGLFAVKDTLTGELVEGCVGVSRSIARSMAAARNTETVEEAPQIVSKPLGAKAVANYRQLARTAPSESARGYWTALADRG